MKRNLSLLPLLAAFFMLFTACVKDPEDSRTSSGPEYSEEFNEDGLVKGVLRIKLSPELETRVAESSTRAGETITQFGVSTLDEIAAELGASSIERSFYIGGKYEPRQRKAGLHLWYTVYFDESQPIARATKSMLGVSGIEIAEPVPVIYPLEAPTVVDTSQPATTRADAAPFNDPFLATQWHYKNDGSLNSAFKAGADINLYKAWEITTGTNDVIVAVIDSGIEYTHVDLADNMWVNTAEYGGGANTDDDNNGYTDDIHGWNFYDRTAQSVTPVDNLGVKYGHGTHVAGTVAAVNNNAKGGGGVAGGDGTPGSGARIMACQINSGSAESPDPDRILKAFQYATDNGAVIAQCSWGYNRSETSLPASDKVAIDYFTNYAGTDNNGETQTGPIKGGLAIFATGNWSLEVEIYPAAYSEVLSVTSIGADYLMPSYAVRGRWVDVCAPGGSNITNAGTLGQVYSTLPDNQYGYTYGTSMACPHVSGIAALLISKYGKEHPGLTGKDIKRMIINSTNDIYTHNPTYVGKLGTGYVDAYRALTMADDTEVTPAAPELEFTVYNRRIDMKLTANAEDGVYPNRYTVLMSEREITDADFDASASDVIRREVSLSDIASDGTAALSYADLKPNTEYYFAVKAHMLLGIKTTVSRRNMSTQNNNPPMDITDLSVAMAGLSAFTTWSVAADPDDIRALYYNLSYSTRNLSTENWADIATDITTVRIEVGSKLSGQELSYMITGLAANTVYYVAVQGFDTRTNESAPAFATLYTGSNVKPETIKELQSLALPSAGDMQQIDLSTYFSNDDPLGLTYTVTVTPENSLIYSIEGDILKVAPADGFSGTGTLTVRASDFAGLSATISTEFSVGKNSASSTLNQYVTDALTVTFPAGTTGNASVKVYNAAGNVVKNVTAEIPAGLQLVVNMSSVSSGVYSVMVKHGAREDKHTIVKL